MRNRTVKRIAIAFIVIWFMVGGIGHFLVPNFFLQIIPPSLPFRIQAVYLSGFFELVGAAGLLHPMYRKSAGVGLFVLTIVVTPANVYMWLNPTLFPAIPKFVLAFRLVVQVMLLALIWWSSQNRNAVATR